MKKEGHPRFRRGSPKNRPPNLPQEERGVNAEWFETLNQLHRVDRSRHESQPKNLPENLSQIFLTLLTMRAYVLDHRKPLNVERQ